jgi:DNA repair ATPase RecN
VTSADFEDLVADEVDYNISGRVSKKAVDELVAAGNLEELARLLANEDEDVN